MTGTRDGHGLRPLAGRLALRGPGAHPPRPVLVVAVVDDQGQRRTQRTAVAKACEHLHAVGLDLLAWAASVALLSAVQVVVDRLAVEDETGREPGHDRDERRAVRLA